jgi:hypothetical protein
MALSYLLRQGGNEGWVDLAQHDGFVTYTTTDGGTDYAPCMWFARCTRPAAVTVSHPILGDVPCCQPCSDYVSKSH